MKKRQVLPIILVFTVFLIYSLPYLILKQNCVINAWDNLDSYFIWYRVIAKYGWFLPLNFTIPEFMGGVPRNVFQSDLIFQVAIFNFLTPLKAYIAVDLLGRIVGFFGMFLLLKDYILKSEKENTLLLCGISLCFALIPNYLTLTFLTMLGQPLWLWAFLNIRKGDYKYYNWIVISIIPFCVNFELITPFFLMFVGGIWLYDLITKKKLNLVFLGSILYCGIISIISIYRFIYVMYFDKTFIPHRKDWTIAGIQIFSHFSFLGSIWEGIKMSIFQNGEVCSHAANKLVLYPTMLFAIIYGAIKKQTKYLKSIIGIFSIMLLFSIIYGIFFHYEPFQTFLDNNLFLRQFQLSRFYFMLPMLWILVFAISLAFIKEIFPKYGKYIVCIIISIQIGYLFTENPYFMGNVNRYVKKVQDIKPTYKEYLAEKQFTEIKDFIGRPQKEYNVAILGYLPYNTAAYNGFNSINGYLNLYRWEQKQKLNKLNKKLIDRRLAFKVMLKFWGHQQVIHFDENFFDTDIMENDLKVNYLFSNKEMVLKPNSKIHFLKAFQPETKGGYPIYVYELR